jgi:hypothetical protein
MTLPEYDFLETGSHAWSRWSRQDVSFASCIQQSKHVQHYHINSYLHGGIFALIL